MRVNVLLAATGVDLGSDANCLQAIANGLDQQLTSGAERNSLMNLNKPEPKNSGFSFRR